MARFKLIINDELMERVKATAERLWPGHGTRAVLRFARDAVRRYLRYCDGKPRH
jgi:hypothetical protein